MNIGILTSSLAGNYGGILQNYALQQVLKSLGHNPITIDHYKPYSRLRWIFGRLVHPSYKRLVPFPFYGRVGSKKVLDFAFHNINRTKKIRTITSDVLDDYSLNVIIVGSDQVWRKAYTNLDLAFLRFTEGYEIKRIAYAASIGADDWEYTESETAACRELISNFDAVSVREKSDVSLCQKHLRITPHQVLDPTLLLNANHYNKFFKANMLPADDYLFAYILDVDDCKRNFVNGMANSMKLKPIIMSAENNAKNDDSIEKWLTLIANASFVITDSYHGTLFSINFNKEFLTINNVKRGNSRFKSILGQTGLLNRLLSSDELSVRMWPGIYWEQVSSIIDNERKKSIRFLESALQ